MTSGKIFKYGLLVLLLDIALFSAAVGFILGDTLLEGLHGETARAAFGSASVISGTDLGKDILLENLIFKKQDQKIFHSGDIVSVSCSGKYFGTEPRKFDVYIKTSPDEFARKTFSLKQGEEFEVTGEFSPKEAGQVPVACRAEGERLLKFMLVANKTS